MGKQGNSFEKDLENSTRRETFQNSSRGAFRRFSTALCFSVRKQLCLWKQKEKNESKILIAN